MTLPLDANDAQILALLQADARTPHAELAARLNLSDAEVGARIARMEQAGVITGYHARVDPLAAGLGISAYIRISSRGYVTPLAVVASQIPGVIECHTLTGDHDSLVRVVAPDVAGLEAIIVELMRCGVTSTALILSSPVPQKPILPPTATPP